MLVAIIVSRANADSVVTGAVVGRNTSSTVTVMIASARTTVQVKTTTFW